MEKNPLKELKIIEIASVLAGPSVGLFFAEMGAYVLKIENKKIGGDVTRSWKLPSEDKTSTVSAYFASVNWNKKYISLDFTSEVELNQAITHIKDADILIANFKHGDAEKFGLDYQKIKLINPKLIYGEISGFGENSDRVAYDLILQAESGFMSINGTAASGPVKMPVALIDLLAGHQLKEGILVALLQRLNDGRGRRVHVSLFDSAVASLANQASNWLMTNINPQRIGSKHPNIAPYGEIFQTKDEAQITLAIGSNKQFNSLCSILNLSQISTDAKFNSNQSRVIHRVELEKILAEKIVAMNHADLLNQLAENFVPAAKIKSISEVFTSEVNDRLVLHETIENTPTKRVKSVAFKID